VSNKQAVKRALIKDDPIVGEKRWLRNQSKEQKEQL
jgi:hypothetical protein